MAQRRLGEATDSLSQSYTRLSSGLRINNASDDAAGLSIADSLRADSRVFAQGIRNLNDGISALNIAQGTLQELSSVVTRQMELAEQASNGVYSLSQRRALHDEVDSLVKEFNRIVSATSFNGLRILDGSQTVLTLQGGYGSNSILSTSIGALFDREVGTGHFDTSSYATTASGPVGPVSGDFNKDGSLDVAYAQSDGRLSILLNNGDGTFKAPVTYLTGGGVYYDLVVDDFNGDGNLDLATGNTLVKVFYGNGDGTFLDAVTFDEGSPGIEQSRAIKTGDFNGDGIRDIVVSNWNTNTVGVLLGNGGNGGFRAAVTFSTVSNANDVAVGDLNGDGVDDIGVGTFSGGHILFSNGDGTFRAPVSIHDSAQRSVEFGDFNRDGKLDVVFGHSSGTGRNYLSMYLGNGNGSFLTARTLAISGDDASRIRVGDINGDGYDDIAVTVRSGVDQLQVLLGNGDGSFLDRRGTSVAVNPTGVALFDANNDGVLDAWVTNSSSSVSNYLTARETTTTSEQAFYLLNRQGALSALEGLRDTLTRINLELGSIGSHQSRLSVAMNTLGVSRENFLGAESRIRDIDVASETSQLLLKQISQRAAAAVLAQANLQPQIALQLLRS